MKFKNESLSALGTFVYLSGLSLIVFFFFFFVSTYNESYLAHAEKYKHIAIEFSETCRTLQAIDDYDTCSNPEYVKALFPPNKLKPSFQLMFENANQGQAQKYQQNSIILNHKFSCVKSDYCNVFDTLPGQKIIYWFEPDSKTNDYYDAKITISANIRHKNIDEKDVIQDNGTARKIELDTNQINIKYCRQVTFDPNYIEFELGRLIWFISDNCADKTKLGYLADPFVIDLNKTDLGDLSDSYAWNWLNNQTQIKEKYKEYRIGKD